MENSNKPQKVVLLTNMLPPYRIGFYEYLAEKYDFMVLSDKVNSTGRLWKDVSKNYKFSFRIMNSSSFMLKRSRADVGYVSKREFSFSAKTFFELRKEKPETVITIEYGFKTLWALLYAKLYGKKVILWSEGTLHTEGSPNFIRRCLRKFIVPRVDVFWTNGCDSTALVNKYSPSKDVTIIEAMTGVDTYWWKSKVAESLLKRDELRSQFGIEGTCILVNGSITVAKGTPQLMKAIDAWAKKRVSLVLIGSGELEAEVSKWAESHEFVKLIMPGFISPEKMPDYMAAADWSVLPTLDDNWPLASLEVLMSGLPQLFSCYNGGAVDLCIDGVTGYTFDPLDPDDFDRALELIDSIKQRVPEETIDISANKYSPNAMGERAIESISVLNN